MEANRRDQISSGARIIKGSFDEQDIFAVNARKSQETTMECSFDYETVKN